MHNIKKILVVEDNDDCRELFARFVKSLGYKVFEAATGIEAIDRASAINPDLIIMDLRMPGMDGGETTARLKMSPSTKDIPVLINTAYIPVSIQGVLLMQVPQGFCISPLT